MGIYREWYQDVVMWKTRQPPPKQPSPSHWQRIKSKENDAAIAQ